ncbi:MAG: hypothetical protein SVX43_14930 [Cyanobacteriota bacterium]|nr:hypothetical protein [Cyanobacteriota bacterium]
MELFSTFFQFLNLILVPLYCFQRFRKSNYFILFNPCFYLLIAAYLYLTIPSLLLPQYIEWVNIDYYSSFKSESLQITNILCNWYVLVFFLFYMQSTDWKVIPKDGYKPRNATYQIALFFVVSLLAYFCYLLARYGAFLFSADRIDALNFYGKNILRDYKVLSSLHVFLGGIAVIVWRTKNFRWFAVLLVPIFTEFLARGRTRSLMIVVFSYINYIANSRKTFAKPIIFLGVAYTIFIPIYRAYEGFDGFKLILEDPQILLFRGLGEIFATRITTVIAYEELMYAKNLGIYLMASFLRLFPIFIYNFLLGDSIDPNQVNYTEMMQEYYNRYYDINWGLAGNIVTESLVYGGIELAAIGPLIIGGIFWFLNQSKIHETFPGFIFLCSLLSQLQRIIRSSFYDSFIILIYVMFSYLLWITLLEQGRKALTIVKK